MKKLWWFSRTVAVAAALYCIFSLSSGSFQRIAKAEACEETAVRLLTVLVIVRQADAIAV